MIEFKAYYLSKTVHAYRLFANSYIKIVAEVKFYCTLELFRLTKFDSIIAHFEELYKCLMYILIAMNSYLKFIF